MMQGFLVLVVKFYRKCLSPLKLRSCRFYPTCSEYSLECLQKYGATKAIFKSIKRITKCHPFHPGGYDPVK